MYMKLSGTIISYNFKTKEMIDEIDKECEYAKNNLINKNKQFTSYWYSKDFFPIKGDKIYGLNGKFRCNSFPNKGNKGQFVDVLKIIRTDDFDNKMAIKMNEIRIEDYDSSTIYKGFQVERRDIL